VYAAHDVVAANGAVGEQCAAVLASAVQHGDVVVVADDDEIDVADECSERLPIGQIGPTGEGVGLHGR